MGVPGEPRGCGAYGAHWWELWGVPGAGNGGRWELEVWGKGGKMLETGHFWGKSCWKWVKMLKRGICWGKKWLKTAHFLGKPAENR